MCSSADWETSSLYKARLGHSSRPRDHDRQLSSFDEVGGQDGSLGGFSDPSMQWESKRLESFRHWPTYAFKDTVALAKAGFFYTKIRDRVKCFCCGIAISSWKANHDPVERHARKKRQCPLVQSQKTADNSCYNAFPGSPSPSSTLSPSAVQTNGTPRESGNAYPASSFSEMKSSTELPSELSLSNGFANKVKVSEPLPTSLVSENGSISSTVSSSLAMGAGSPINSMDNVSMRLSTFFEKGWPAGSPVTPKDLSENGFYCLGKGDAVRCYICSVTLKGWEVGDTAEGEHRRHSPMCPLVTSKSKFIDSASLPSALSATAINPSPNQHGSKSMWLDDATMDMASEGNRRDSFFLQKWIQGLGISNPADAFAKAGFYSTRQSDLVKCFHCGLIIDGWSRGMKPLDEHLKRSPSCSFVSVARERQAESAKAAKSSSDDGYMTSFEDRLKSFIFWPHSEFISPNDLAEAGLYYTGQGDAAQCFWCHGVLRYWQKGDVPWKEHAMHFGERCQFVKKYAPAEIAVSHAGYDKPLPTKATSPLLSELVLPSDVRAGLQSDLGSIVEDMETTSSVLRDDDELLQRVLAEGALRQLAERLITSHRQKSDKPYSYNEFMEDYYSAEEEKSASTLASEVSFGSSAIRKMLGGDSAMIHSNTDLESSVEELKTLRDSRLCKVCMNRDANVVFIPCGHVSCCQLCASSLTVCPICRCKFTNKVTAFFS
ncbi:death-associated inhibitor of apoptosis 2-like [Oscarella lobularis]|uniref:death-associated inhibitor of apoptosis 2-like n=1 Tax=Oscarella lobularis TaxID=121494 RepID=UPI0033137F8D